MSFPSPDALKKRYPLAPSHRSFIDQSRQMVRSILQGTDPKVAIVTGPCSIHDITSALEYGHRLKELSLEVAASCFLVMRCYVEKPRTSTGWKGFVYDPFLDGSHALIEGLKLTRQLFLELTSLNLPIAMEFLDPFTAPYLEDLVSWGFIGARTSASQPHRQLASLLPLPIGFKNSVDGNIDLAIHGVIAARSPHSFLHLNSEGYIDRVQSPGNQETHIVLRGSESGGNFDPASIEAASKKLISFGIEDRFLIDCSHGNSNRCYEQQKDVFLSLLQQMPHRSLMGVMLESHLKCGQQTLTKAPLDYGVSITDPCIDWETTASLISKIDLLRN